VRAAAVKNVTATNAAKKERGERKIEDGAKDVDGGLAGEKLSRSDRKTETGPQLSAANRESPTRFLRT
jgi:hypothetical protein